MKIKLLGLVSRERVCLSIPKKFKRFFPDYFIIEIDTETIKKRKKGDKEK